MNKCISCGKQKTENSKRFCLDCFRQLKKANKIVECEKENCGQWHYANMPCLCMVEFAQCPECGRWYNFSDECICKITVEKAKIYEETPLIYLDEEMFRAKLEQVIDTDKYYVNCQLPLRQFVAVNKQNSDKGMELNPRYIDFGIIQKGTGKVVLCIEYDGSSHERNDRKIRDAEVDKIITEAGYKIIHIKRDDNMTLDYLRAKIEDYL